MPLSPLKTSSKLSYSALKRQVLALANRMNVLTDMRVTPVSDQGDARFHITSTKATLDLPKLDDIIKDVDDLKRNFKTALDECESNSGGNSSQELEDCQQSLQEVQADKDALCQDLVAQPGSWSVNLSFYEDNGTSSCANYITYASGTASVFIAAQSGQFNNDYDVFRQTAGFKATHAMEKSTGLPAPIPCFSYSTGNSCCTQFGFSVNICKVVNGAPLYSSLNEIDADIDQDYLVYAQTNGYKFTANDDARYHLANFSVQGGVFEFQDPYNCYEN